MSRHALCILVSLASVCPAADAGAKTTPIDRFEKRVARDPGDSASRVLLARSYLRRLRSEGDHSAARRAEELLREADDIRPDLRGVAPLLAAALAAQHRFADARAIARADWRAGGDIASLAAWADAALELGSYDETRDLMDRLEPHADDPRIAARIARFEEVTGRVDEALRRLTRAVEQVHRSGPLGDRGWYEWRLGTLLLSEGRVDEAETCFQTALACDPEDSEAMVGLARTARASGRRLTSEERFRAALKLRAEPTTMIELGELLLAYGEQHEAEALIEQGLRQMAYESVAYQGIHDRELASWLARLGRDPDRAVELARSEIDHRRDVHTLDTLAWALFQNGELDEAASRIDEAIAIGSTEPAVLYHAGRIHLARGDERGALLIEQAHGRRSSLPIADAMRVVEILESLPPRPDQSISR